MPYKIPSLDETRAFLLALGKALFPSANFGSLRSYHGRRTTFLSAGVTELHAHIDSVQRDAHPLTASEGPPINGWGDAAGVPRKSATPARKSAAGRVSGAAAATVASGAALRHEATGLLFAVNQDVTIVSTYIDADIVAIDTGSQTRLAAGEVLKFVSTPVGIETNVVLQLDLDEDGNDSEQFGSYRNRVLATFSQAPSGGNQADFVKWALASLNAVASAYGYPNRAGRGTFDVVAFSGGSGTSRSLSSDDRALVAAYIRTKAPWHIAGAGGALRVLETVADPQDIEIGLATDGQASHAFDWDDTDIAGAPAVGAWNAGTRELTFDPAPLPASLRAGHRIVLVGGDHDGREYKIESISDVATGKVILEKVPVAAVVAAQVIYSGGPLVTPVRDAIVAHLNGLAVYAGRGPTPLPADAVASAIGLDVLAYGIGSANPAGLYGTWTGAIVRATLYKIAMFKAGVRNAAILAPLADYEAVDDAFPSDDQIHYVTPGAVVVRNINAAAP